MLVIQPAEARPWCGSDTLSPTETLICASAELRDLDADLARLYGSGLVDKNDAAQKAWLKDERDVCGTDWICNKRAYEERLRELQ